MDSNANSTTRSAAGAKGLDGKYVTSEEVFRSETEKIFSRNWICVARDEELHDESLCLPIRIENQNLFLTEDEHGATRAFRNFCRHRGSQLVSESNCSSVGLRIQCPYHAWTYDRSGRLVSAPNMNDVEGFCQEDHGLMEVACQRLGGFIWINFNPNEELKDWLAPIADRLDSWSLNELRIEHEIQYNVAANWKLIFQNYSECYHCPTVHPALNRLTPYKGSSNDLEAGPILGGPMSLANDVETMSMDGKRVGDVLPKLNQDQTRSIHYFTIAPTMFLSLHPDYVLIHLIQRVGVSESAVKCQFLFHPSSMSSRDFDAGSIVDFWDQTNRQDWEVCELAQTGMSDANYVPGPYSNLESVVAAFDDHYLAEMKRDQP